MQVTAFSTAARPEWRWRICGYGGEIIEESHDHFLTIAAAVAQGAKRSAGSRRPQSTARSRCHGSSPHGVRGVGRARFSADDPY
jgi:hypothetical protein